MPLISQKQVETNLGLRQQDLPEFSPEAEVKGDKPSFGQAFAAGFRLENVPYNLVDKSFNKGIKAILEDIPEDGFDALDELEKPENAAFREFAESAINIKNQLGFNEWKTRVSKQVEDRRIMSEGGFGGLVGAMAGSVLDPTIFIPGVALLKGGRSVANITKGLTTGAAFGAGAVGVQETVLQATQETRTLPESAINIAAGGVLGGIFGGSLGALAKADRLGAEDLVRKAFKNEDVKMDLPTEFEGSSVGAAQISPQVLKEREGLLGLNKWVAKVAGFNNPIVRGLTSTSGRMREFTNDMFEHSFRTGKQKVGGAETVSVESLLEADTARQLGLNRKVRDIYHGHIKSGGKLKYDEFRREVAIAMSKGDESPFKEAATAAKMYRQEINNAVKQLQDLNVMPKEIGQFKANKDWYMQVWNKEEISTRRNNFTVYLANKFEDPLRTKSQFKTMADLSDEAVESAEKSIDNILGLGDDALGFEHISRQGIGAPRSTKQRVIDIPQDEAHAEGWLIMDAEHGVNSFLHNANITVRMKQWLQSKGYDTIADLKVDVRDEFTKSIDKTDDIKAKKRLAKELDRSLKDIDDFVDLQMGTFTRKSPAGQGTIASGLRTLRKYNVLNMLGGVTLSSIPDLAGHILVSGFGRTLRDGLTPIVRNLKAAKLQNDELADLVLGLRATNDDIIRRLTETGRATGKATTAPERVGDAVVDVFGYATGMNYWNAANRMVASRTVEARTFRALTKKFKQKKPLSTAESQRLKDIGLNQEMQERIYAEFSKHGEEIDGSFLGHFSRWTDKEAKDILAASLNREVNNVVLVPGKGDQPKWAQTEIGKTIAQFKSFTFTASNRLLLRGIQRHDSNTLMGVVTATFLGAMVGILKNKIEGRDVDTSLHSMIIEGVSRSGISGILGDSWFGLNPWSGSTRYAGLKFHNFAFGPSASTAGNLYSTAAGLMSDGSLSESEAKKLRRLIPFNNLFYLRAAVNAYKD